MRPNLGSALAVGFAAFTVACGVAWLPPAHGQVAPPEAAQVVAPAQDAPDAAAPEFATPTTLDRAGRILATVEVPGRGSYRFILDTGANRSAVSERMVKGLGLVPSRQAVVHGITGSAVMPLVLFDELRVGELRFPEQWLAILPDAVFGDADGILGIDVLQRARVDVDVQNDEVVIRRSARNYSRDRMTVRATLRSGGLLVVRGEVGRVRVKAIIDTGAERSLGNLKLREALAARRRPLTGAVTQVVGATAQVAEGYSLVVPTIGFGGGVFVDNLTVTFGDFHVFKVWSLTDEPALVVGMDALGTLPEFSIDYPRRRLELKVQKWNPAVGTMSPTPLTNP